MLDVDDDGNISRDDLRSFYSEFSVGGEKAAEEEVIGTMMSVVDSNKDEYVEYGEFEKVLDSRRNGSRGGERLGVMEEAFRVMDRDGDGRVGEEDLRSYLWRAGF
ncbi:Calcium-binding protein CP1 [Camellia lanceoleosa]|uniref:Calcium-binding protein CP1 n=1 Tax=Camellia lanceoleosa TaxID=1840588 RepID=A0ACC0HHI6_9ERIC|nr:Calcium-binding protein CP1 [Camellia lanceoleosa]